MLQKANEPLLLIRQLRRLGGLSVEVDSSRLPLLDVIEPEAAYLSWTFTLDTGAPQSAIDEVFEFVEDDCDLRVETGAVQVPEADASLEARASGADVPGTRVRAMPAVRLPRLIRSRRTTLFRLVQTAHSIRVDVDRVRSHWSIWSAKWSSLRPC